VMVMMVVLMVVLMVMVRMIIMVTAPAHHKVSQYHKQ
jgi:hypothetical protein